MTAVVLLSHGSPDQRSAEAARDLALRAGVALGRTVVAAFLQHDRPDLSEQCRELARVGHGEAVVVPMLITPAFHARVDVPAAVREAEEQTGLRLSVGDPLGTDPLLLDAADRYLPSGPVVLAAAGTSDPAAQTSLERLAADWAARRGAPVAVAYASQALPDVATAIRGVESSSGAPVAVAPFVLYPGVLPDRIAAAAGDRPHSAPLAQAPEVVDLIRERVHQAQSTRTTPTHERTPA